MVVTPFLKSRSSNGLTETITIHSLKRTSPERAHHPRQFDAAISADAAAGCQCYVILGRTVRIIQPDELGFSDFPPVFRWHDI